MTYILAAAGNSDCIKGIVGVGLGRLQEGSRISRCSLSVCECPYPKAKKYPHSWYREWVLCAFLRFAVNGTGPKSTAVSRANYRQFS